MKSGLRLDALRVTGTFTVWHLEALLLGSYLLNILLCTFVTWERGGSRKTPQAHQPLVFLKTRSLIFVHFPLLGFLKNLFPRFFLIKYDGLLLFNLLAREKNKLLSEEYALQTSDSSDNGDLQQLSTLLCFGYFPSQRKIWIISGLSLILLIMACTRKKLMVIGPNLV